MPNSYNGLGDRIEDHSDNRAYDDIKIEDLGKIPREMTRGLGIWNGVCLVGAALLISGISYFPQIINKPADYFANKTSSFTSSPQTSNSHYISSPLSPLQTQKKTEEHKDNHSDLEKKLASK